MALSIAMRLGAAESMPSTNAALNPNSSTPPVTASAVLEYQIAGFVIANWPVTVTPKSGMFKHEPPAVKGKVVRGQLNFGGDAKNSLGFLWQCEAGKLFIDLNRNQDLADETPSESSARSSSRNYGVFTNIKLPLEGTLGNAGVAFDVNLWDFNSGPSCSASVRSFWGGKLTLNGKDCQVALVQKSLEGNSAEERYVLLLRSWEHEGQMFSTFEPSFQLLPFSKKLFVDGHAYGLELMTGGPAEQGRPVVAFTEQTPPLAELKLTGKFVKRLVMRGDYLVALNEPAGLVKVPAGNYAAPSVLLEQSGKRASHNTDSTTSKPISITGTNETVLALGGPLTNSASAVRHGRNLNLNYRLIGGGGETYELVDQNRSTPPEFVVYKGGKQLASGKFEFG